MRISRLISQLSCSNFDFFVPGQRRWSIPIWTYSTGISHYWIIASPQDLEEKFLWQNSYWNQKLDFFFQNNFCKSRKTFRTILNFCFRFFQITSVFILPRISYGWAPRGKMFQLFILALELLHYYLRWLKVYTPHSHSGCSFTSRVNPTTNFSQCNFDGI